MTDDLRTEDDIARLFADANPVPNRPRAAHDGDRSPDGPRSEVMIDLHQQQREPADAQDPGRSPSRWWPLAAAAAVALVVSLGVAAFDRDDPAADEPASTAPTITTPDTLPPPRLQLVENFVAAVSVRDVAAARRTLAPGFVPVLAPGADDPEAGTASLDDHLAWLDAFGWTWEIDDCRPVGVAGMRCAGRERNRLTDPAGFEIPSTMRFGFQEGLIETLSIQRDWSRYGPEAFVPFYSWVVDHHPDDVERLWIPAGGGVTPILTSDAARLMDERLTEYLAIGSDDATASGADVAIAENFVQAVNERDLDALNRIAADPAVLIAELADTSDPAMYFAWLDAFDWRWEEAECAAEGEAAVCRVFIRNKLTDATDVERPGVVSLSVVDGLVDDLSVVDYLGHYSTQAFVPFVEWVAATYPGDLRKMWTITYSGISPLHTEESVPLFATHLDEYSASVPLPTPAHRMFLTAQASGDVDSSTARLAPDAVVDQLWAASADDLPGLSRLLAGLGWDWNIQSCSISTDDLEPDRTGISCVADPTWRLDDRDIGVTPTIVEFEFTSAGIASVRTGSRERLAADLAPLFDWIRTTHPDDADTLLAEQGGTTGPVLSDAAVEHLLQLVEEYLSRSDG